MAYLENVMSATILTQNKLTFVGRYTVVAYLNSLPIWKETVRHRSMEEAFTAGKKKAEKDTGLRGMAFKITEA